MTLGKSFLPYITANIPNTPMQHGYKTQHSTVTALHTLNNTVANGFNQLAPPARTITVALYMSKAFDTRNIHTLIRKLLQTNIPGTIIKCIANYIKGRKAYTTYRNHTSRQRQFKTCVPQGGVLHPHYLTFTPQTYHHPVHRFRPFPSQMTSHPHTHKHECSQEIYTTITTERFCLDKTKQSHPKSRQNNLHSVHATPCRIYEQSGTKNTQQYTIHGNAPKGSGSYLRPKTHIQHTHPQHLSARAHTSANH